VSGWLSQQFPDFHDFAAQDVSLNGTEFHAPDSVPGLNLENQVTAPFMPVESGPIAEADEACAYALGSWSAIRPLRPYLSARDNRLRRKLTIAA